ncbi:hypothetical protein [Collimonas sp.]|jgi:hypothetical protein|uniref:hypothetical protein n=1 Tax=Collimonas sp. TaxID=1963772 RepID=UPI002C14E2E7|nr:hypothetical protein [Collimonas sp.]HWW08249.1 hypothetical protein [Collimonas sp.]
MENIHAPSVLSTLDYQAQIDQPTINQPTLNQPSSSVVSIRIASDPDLSTHQDSVVPDTARQDRSGWTVAHGVAVEAARQGVAAYVGWGLAKCSAEALYLHIKGDAYDPGSYASNLEKAAFVAPFLTVGHYVGNVVLAPAVQWALRGSIAPVDPQQAFPDAVREEHESDHDFAARQADIDKSRQAMSKMQAVGRPGQLTANLIGDAGFGLASALQPFIYTGANASSPPIRAMASLGGGTLMGAGWGLLNMTTRVNGQLTHTIIPAKKLGDMLLDSLKKIPILKDLGMRAVANGSALMSLAAVQTKIAHNVQAENPGKPLIKSPGVQPAASPEQRFANGMAGGVTPLEGGFFANLGLAARGSPDSPALAETLDALKKIDPRTSPGSLATLLVGEPGSAVAQVANVVLQAVEMPYHSAQGLLGLPGHIAFDIANGLHSGLSRVTGHADSPQNLPQNSQERSQANSQANSSSSDIHLAELGMAPQQATEPLPAAAPHTTVHISDQNSIE